MTAIQFLRQYEVQQGKVDRLQAEYDKEREMIDSIKSPLGSDGETHGSGISRRTEDAAIRLSDKLYEFEAAKIEAIEKRQLVFNAIIDIPGIEGEVLYEKYINLKSWPEVIKTVHCSRRAVFYYHSRALKKVKVCTLLHF